MINYPALILVTSLVVSLGGMGESPALIERSASLWVPPGNSPVSLSILAICCSLLCEGSEPTANGSHLLGL